MSEGHTPFVEFSDFQCPYCATAAERLTRLERRFPGQVAVAYHHLPLSRIHPHALPAALAAECAGAQNRFKAYHDALFAAQESLGNRPWDAFADVAAVPDIAEFRRCLASGKFKGRVERDVKSATALGVTGTPTFVMNGRLVVGPAALDSLERWTERATAGR